MISKMQPFAQHPSTSSRPHSLACPSTPSLDSRTPHWHWHYHSHSHSHWIFSSDIDYVTRTLGRYRLALQLQRRKVQEWDPPVHLCSALTEVGISELWDKVLSWRDQMVDTGTFDQRRGLQVIDQRTCRSRGVTSRLVLHAPFAPFAEPLRSCVHATIPASHRLSLVRDTDVSVI